MSWVIVGTVPELVPTSERRRAQKKKAAVVATAAFGVAMG
jgi:hypothetical protein